MKKGDKIYVPTSLYVYRGMEDFQGGLATISKIKYDKNLPEDHINHIFIEIKERPGVSYNYKVLLQDQDKLKKRFGDQVAHLDPDERPEFNCSDADWV